MKIPLRFQITEYDCGTIALENAISYLFDRENVPAELIRAITIYTINCYDEKGKLTEGGTTREVMDKMTHWITKYAQKNNFGIKCERYEKEEVDMGKIFKCVKAGGCVLVRTYQNGEHFAVVTEVDDKYVYLWDSYYLGETYYDHERQVTIIFNRPFNYNRQVSIKRFTAESERDFALGPIEKRECVLFNKDN